MQNPQSRIDDYQEQVYKDVVFLLNSRLSLLKQLNADENRILWAMAFGGTFYVFNNSLFDNLVVTLSWLFSDREQRSLIWYLKQVKEHSQIFSKAEIDAQLKLIENAAETIEKLKTRRDKWIAHRDASASNNRDKFLKENKIEIEDFERLVNLAEEIIQEHFGRFQTAEVDFELPANDINDLARCISQRQELLLFLGEFDISIRKDNFMERIIQARKNLSIGF